MNFEPAPCKDCMKEFGFTVLASSKLYMVMEKWRREAMNFKERNSVNLPNNTETRDSTPSAETPELDQVTLSML